MAPLNYSEIILPLVPPKPTFADTTGDFRFDRHPPIRYVRTYLVFNRIGGKPPATGPCTRIGIPF
jgi:hypothetical protein